MTCKQVGGLLLIVVLLSLSTMAPVCADDVQATGIDNPKEFATLSALRHPDLNCAVQAELDAGILSMLKPVLKQVLQSKSGMPEPLDDIGEALEQMGPEIAQSLAEFVESIHGIALAMQMPADGQEVNVPEMTAYYKQRALSTGWKIVVGVSEKPTEVITIFQLPTPVATDADARPPQGLVLTVVTPKQVIAAGILGELHLGKILPVLVQIGGMSRRQAPTGKAEPTEAPVTVTE